MNNQKIIPILLCCFFLIHCNTKQNSKIDNRLFHHWMNHDSLHPGGLIISTDSIFYPDYNRSFPYSITGDSLTIFMIDITNKSRYQIKNDTLLFFDKEGISIFWK